MTESNDLQTEVDDISAVRIMNLGVSKSQLHELVIFQFSTKSAEGKGQKQQFSNSYVLDTNQALKLARLLLETVESIEVKQDRPVPVNHIENEGKCMATILIEAFQIKTAGGFRLMLSELISPLTRIK